MGELLRGGGAWLFVCVSVLVIHKRAMDIDPPGVLHNDDEDPG